jgi:hypothetical protein
VELLVLQLQPTANILLVEVSLFKEHVLRMSSIILASDGVKLWDIKHFQLLASPQHDYNACGPATSLTWVTRQQEVDHPVFWYRTGIFGILVTKALRSR